MPSFFSTSTSDSKQIVLFSDTNLNSDYPVLLHYINGVLTYTYTVNGNTYSIGGTSYSPTPSNVSDLNFQLENTQFGSLYTFHITPTVTGIPNDEFLSNGVHNFMILNFTNPAEFYETGELIKQDIDCCIAKKLDKAFSGACDKESALIDVQNVFAIVQSIGSSISMKEWINANSKLKLALNICNSNCECGCS